MSERDDSELRLLVGLLAVFVVLATVMSWIDWGEVRDLQCRVGQLEQERR